MKSDTIDHSADRLPGISVPGRGDAAGLAEHRKLTAWGGGVRSAFADQRVTRDLHWSGGTIEAVQLFSSEWSYRVRLERSAWFVILDERIEDEYRKVDDRLCISTSNQRKYNICSFLPAQTMLEGSGRNVSSRYLAFFLSPTGSLLEEGPIGTSTALTVGGDAATFDLASLLWSEIQRSPERGMFAGLLADALHHKLQCLTAADDPAKGTRLSKHRLDNVRQLIEHSLADTLSVSELAREAGLSRYHFQRAFKTSTGLTVTQYLYARRVARAKSMLGGGASVTEAAHACGFSSSQHLAVSFRRHTGMTPSVYRSASNGR